MAVRDVLRMGHPVLRERAKPVEDLGSAELKRLVADMKETMAFKNGAGLAAPQIGVSQRVVIFGVEANPRYPDAEPVPFTVLVNPKLVMLTREVEEDWEGCLSVPGMRGVVPRYTKLRYTGFDEDGNAIDRVAEGFHARVVQHECDHLDGILYPQRMTDLSKLGFNEELFPGEDLQDD
ncbi:MAG TPA: peptide deformylase [Usitatibacter sp.]|nr:peptide deformylase [Usitatibacter sp.]